ncbi:MAG: spore coat protein CotJB, partial [Clostridia bacterium]|nr:spore coat protein CotJB [Clostridia bacterium]
MDNRDTLLQRIRAYDFAIVEMNLFLDTHPTDEQALCLFHMYQEKREQLISAYEASFGPY